VAIPRYGRRTEQGLAVTIARLLNELRSPTTRSGKVVAATLAVLVFMFVTLAAVSGFFLSRVMNPAQGGETIDPTLFLGNAQSVDFYTPDGTIHSGWFFPGLRGGPVVIMCHGYKSSREDILTLGTSLQQHRYNVLAFNFAGHGESPVSYTTLGYKETTELQAAIDMLSKRDDIDTQRIGLWGYSLGGYAVLRIASLNPSVKAVVADSAYPRPTALLRIELRKLGAHLIPLLSPMAVAEFRLASFFFGGRDGDVAENMDALAGVPKLFIAGDDTPRLEALTREIYVEAPGPKDLVTLQRSNISTFTEDERRNYENVVVTFFLRSLPLAGPGS
jgi:pimeloyl-ACP methyl ester carboxylesterase